MHPKIREIFKNRIYGDEFLKLYEDMAWTYTNDRIEELYSSVADSNVPLSFSDISTKAAAFNNELIHKATWIRDDYKENKGYSSPKLTRGCKKVISKCVKEYLRALELACTNNQSPTSQKAKSYLEKVA
ncbi:MAG: hypothetical protein H6551_06950 [Chitinophagales bacterium]|nr:hypothetical protein [Chitinophagaceae bacterium]MCB9064869.1 hypothetical protein [Chitinophagales bacterium]